MYKVPGRGEADVWSSHLWSRTNSEVLFVHSCVWFSVLLFRCWQAWLDASNHGVCLAYRSDACRFLASMWQKSLSGGPSACTHSKHPSKSLERQIIPHPTSASETDLNTADHLFSEAPLSKALPRMEWGQALPKTLSLLLLEWGGCWNLINTSSSLTRDFILLLWGHSFYTETFVSETPRVIWKDLVLTRQVLLVLNWKIREGEKKKSTGLTCHKTSLLMKSLRHQVKSWKPQGVGKKKNPRTGSHISR